MDPYFPLLRIYKNQNTYIYHEQYVHSGIREEYTPETRRNV